MEANLSIIDKMLKEHGVTATKDAKQAIVNFSALFGQKMVRKCVQGKPIAKQISTEQIRQAYELSKGLRTVEYEAQLEERKKEAISKVNATKLIKQDEDEDRQANTARSAVSVSFYNSDIYHMSMGKEHQLTYQIKEQNQ